MLELIPLKQLSPSPDNPRRDVGDVTELAASIGSVGIIEPLIVSKNGKGYVIVAGARRFAAAKAAKLTEIPCIVRDLDEKQRAEIMLIENLQREDLAPLEEASAYQRLVALGYTQRELATKVGVSQGHISKRLMLLELPEAAQKTLDAGGITVQDALVIARIKDMPKRVQKVLDEVKRGVDVDRAVKQQEDEHRRAELAGRLVQEAKAKGLRILAVTVNQYGDQTLPKGAVKVDTKGDYRTLGVPNHEKEACHAVALLEARWSDPVLLTLCTDARAHPAALAELQKRDGRSSTGQGAGKLTDAEKAKRALRRKHVAALREAQTNRHAFLRTLLKRSKSFKDDALLLLFADWTTRESGVPYSKIGVGAGALLGVVAKERQYMGADYREAIAKHLAKTGELVKVVLAVGIGSREDAIAVGIGSREDAIAVETGWGGGWTRAKEYFAFLERQGYEPSPAEKLELAGKAPR